MLTVVPSGSTKRSTLSSHPISPAHSIATCARSCARSPPRRRACRHASSGTLRILHDQPLRGRSPDPSPLLLVREADDVKESVAVWTTQTQHLEGGAAVRSSQEHGRGRHCMQAVMRGAAEPQRPRTGSAALPEEVPNASARVRPNPRATSSGRRRVRPQNTSGSRTPLNSASPASTVNTHRPCTGKRRAAGRQAWMLDMEHKPDQTPGFPGRSTRV